MQAITSLRQALARAPHLAAPRRRAALGAAAVDAVLGGGLARGALHDVYAAAGADAPAASGFALALALRLGGKRPLVWVAEEKVEAEGGSLYPAGLAAFGLDPARLLLMRARNAEAALRAGGEAVRCAGLGAVVMTLWGQPRLLDLTASRRLLLAAETSGVPLLLLRAAAPPMPSAAATRWSVRALPSRALEANAPGFPSFSVTLLRQRSGPSGHVWRLEWNHAQRCFVERDAARAGPPLSGAMVSLSPGAGDAAAGAPAERAAEPARRAG